LVGWLFTLAGWSVGGLVGCLSDWLVGLLVGWLARFFFCVLVSNGLERLVGWFIGCFVFAYKQQRHKQASEQPNRKYARLAIDRALLTAHLPGAIFIINIYY